MRDFSLNDYDYFRFGQQYLAVQNMITVTDDYFYVEAQDSHGRTWAMGAIGDGDIYITHDHTDLMMPLERIEFRAYKAIRELALLFGNHQKETFGAKFGSYDGE